jgi:predicted enzyme related to lactoylglutathione lyase
MANATVRGRFVWHELMTTDTKSAASFYSKVVGWKTQAWEHDPSYTTFIANGRPMAGLMLLPEDAKAMGAPPSWLIYIGTADVDEAARQAASLGGKILRAATDIPTIGRFAVIQDPQGAVFAAFTPNQTPESDTEPGVGDFSWHELPTTDWRAAVTFYRQLFGWEPISSMDMGPEMGTYQMYGLKGKTLGGMFNKPKQMAGPPAWLPYITVPDSKKAAATVKKLGGQVVNGPMEVPGGGWIAQGVDLQGAMFAVHSAKPVAVKKAAGATPVKRAAVKEPVETRAAGGAAGTRPTEAKKRSAGAKKKPAAKKGSAKKRPAAAKKRPTVKKRPAAAKRRPAAKKRRR